MIRRPPFLPRPSLVGGVRSLKAPPRPSEAIRQAAQVEREGVAFFRRANRLAADPRVKFIFGRAAEEHENALKALEPLARGKGKPDVPALFPFDEYSQIECYVCGHEANPDEIPETCPGCGAARYAFEKEVTQDRAWDLVARTTKEVLSFTRKVAATVKDLKAKAALDSVTNIQKELMAEAKEERARIAGPAP